jgi:circadian clock protein KaiB
MARARAAERKNTKARLRLRLYVAGTAANSVTAIANTRAICDTHFPVGHDIEIVDVLDSPERALADGIIVTPTLLKLSPLPATRLIGTLNDWNQVLQALAGK